ncbi:unnamed protein product [Lactuca saligna]|uniref:Reverse transcriptase zinc-binding domain-containing protein n=1 Tax=Lactuca saligna TaxID=75948 RepID=A0AA36EEE6_LACSI|nr:unnamed protein product [Lactuca saligna]
MTFNRDYSMGKVGIITSARRWINEEVKVSAGGEIICVGVVEYTDDWSPFMPLQFDKTIESDEEDDTEETDDEDGISETWMQENDVVPEDGEYRADSIFGNNDKTAEEQMEGLESTGEAPATDLVAPNLSIQGAALDIPSIPALEVLASGATLPLGCFGPFPTPINPIRFSAQTRYEDEAHLEQLGCRRKRKRLSKSGQKSNSPHRSVFFPPTDTPGDPGILFPPIDRDLAPNQTNAVSEGNNVPSFSQEVEATAEDRVTPSRYTWDWNANLWSENLNQNLGHLLTALEPFNPSSEPDTWRCTLGSDGIYMVQALRKKLDETTPAIPGIKIHWMKEVPLKVLCFIWRAKWGRVPSAQALISRGVSNISPNCGYCNHTGEGADHIFIHCDFASAVREWIMRWCGVTLGPINTVEDRLDFASNWSQCPKKHKEIASTIVNLHRSSLKPLKGKPNHKAHARWLSFRNSGVDHLIA